MALRSLELTVSGWVANNPEIIHTSKGKPVTVFRLMHTPRFSSNGEWKDGRTMTFSVKAWSHLASNVQACVRKGNPLVVAGRIDISEWVNKDGKRNTDVSLIASSIGFDLAHCQAACWRNDKGENFFDNKMAHEALGTEKTDITVRGSSPEGVELLPFSLRIPDEKLKYVLEKYTVQLSRLTGRPLDVGSANSDAAFGATQVPAYGPGYSGQSGSGSHMGQTGSGNQFNQSGTSGQPGLDNQAGDTSQSEAPSAAASLGTLEPNELNVHEEMEEISVESQSYDDGDIDAA